MRSGLYYFNSLRTRVFKCRWYIKLTGALDPLSDFRSWCWLENGEHFWGLDQSPYFIHGQGRAVPGAVAARNLRNLHGGKP